VPSEGGLSHNIAEFTPQHQVTAGADVLLQVMLERAGVEGC
jgi:N-carbamoyl-L-amino-acid hydrolase